MPAPAAAARPPRAAGAKMGNALGCGAASRGSLDAFVAEPDEAVGRGPFASRQLNQPVMATSPRAPAAKKPAKPVPVRAPRRVKQLRVAALARPRARLRVAEELFYWEAMCAPPPFSEARPEPPSRAPRRAPLTPTFTFSFCACLACAYFTRRKRPRRGRGRRFGTFSR